MREKMEALKGERERERSSEQINCEKFAGGKMKMHLKNNNILNHWTLSGSRRWYEVIFLN